MAKKKRTKKAKKSVKSKKNEYDTILWTVGVVAVVVVLLWFALYGNSAPVGQATEFSNSPSMDLGPVEANDLLAWVEDFNTMYPGYDNQLADVVSLLERAKSVYNAQAPDDYYTLYNQADLLMIEIESQAGFQ